MDPLEKLRKKERERRNRRQQKLWPRLKFFWQRYWLWILCIGGGLISIVLPVWYMAGMEESVRSYIVGINFASMPFGLFQTMVFVGFLYLLHFGGGFSQFKKTKVDAGMVNIRFENVIGLKEAKREAWEVVQLIKDRSRVKKIGGNIVRGVLMTGPPGCGKTMLAKAIASEAGLPFLSVAGSEFVEMFVGVGASRVRKLFKQARQYADAYGGGCIIFIDELEVLAKKRVFLDAFGGSSESNSTLNQLLVEMDGINDSDAQILVMGAMNASEDVLDPAVLRPGRFDRKIQIGRPNLEERRDLFEYYGGKINLDPSVDFGRLARKAVYRTPAEIENILKESALIAARSEKDLVSYKEISEAIERIELGIAHRLNMTEREREMTAYHEVGHLIILYLAHPTSDVFKASIISRGGTLGVVHSTPKEEMFSSDRATLLAHIKVALAGYVAEKFKYGVTTDGVSADFKNATHYAHAMVWKFGMGTSGYIGDLTAIPKEQLSEGLKEKLNMETQEILRECLHAVEKTLKEEWEIVERFVSELLAHDELDYDEIVAIFKEFGKEPVKIATTSPRPVLPSPEKPENAPAPRPPFAPPDDSADGRKPAQ
jgi:cell division protease FtsH